MNNRGDSSFTSLLLGMPDIPDEDVVNSSEHLHQQVHPSQNSSQFVIEPESASKENKRSGNFSQEEDLFIVSAWLNISQDTVQSNEQKAEKYWERIHNYFHTYRSFTSDRNVNSLMNRWSKIQRSVNKFCGCYAQIEGRRQSGVSEQDKIQQAKLMYAELHKSTFAFEHCWNTLRYSPKWLETTKKRNTTSKSNSVGGASSSIPDSINLEEENENDGTPFELERPDAGKKKEKRLKRRKCEDQDKTSIITLIEDMREQKNKTNEEKRHISEKKIKLLESMLAIEKQKEDERIMAIDTTCVPPVLAEYYKRRQKQIMEELPEDN